jgi:hypothetical protein
MNKLTTADLIAALGERLDRLHEVSEYGAIYIQLTGHRGIHKPEISVYTGGSTRRGKDLDILIEAEVATHTGKAAEAEAKRLREEANGLLEKAEELDAIVKAESAAPEKA